MRRILLISLGGVLAACLLHPWTMAGLLDLCGPAEDLKPQQLVRLHLLPPLGMLVVIVLQVLARSHRALGVMTCAGGVLAAALLALLVVVGDRADLTAHQSAFTGAISLMLIAAGVLAVLNLLSLRDARSGLAARSFWSLAALAAPAAAMDLRLGLTRHIAPRLIATTNDAAAAATAQQLIILVYAAAAALLATLLVLGRASSSEHHRVLLGPVLTAGALVALATLRLPLHSTLSAIASTVDPLMLADSVASIFELTAAALIAAAFAHHLLITDDGRLARWLSTRRPPPAAAARGWRRAADGVSLLLLLTLTCAPFAAGRAQRAFILETDRYTVDVFAGRSSGLVNPDGLFHTEDGLYVTCTWPPALSRFRPGSRGVVLADQTTGLEGTEAVVVDAAGTVFVSDDRATRVYAVADGELETVLDDSSGLQSAKGLALGPDGSLFVSDPAGATVFRRAGDNRCAAVARAGNLTMPGEMACDSNGNLYIAEDETSRLIRIGADGSQQVLGDRDSGLRSPEAVAIAGDDVYVTDRGIPGVFHFDAAGERTLLFTLAKPFRRVEGITVDATGTIYVGIRNPPPEPSYILAVTPRADHAK